MKINWRKIRLIIRKPLKAVNNKIMPTGLYGRSIAIIVAPMIILQTIMTLVFMQRHWQSITEDLSQATVRDIAAIIEIIEHYPQDSEKKIIRQIANQQFQVYLEFLSEAELPPPLPKPFFSLLDIILTQELARKIKYPFWIDTTSEEKIVELRIKLNSQIMKIRFRKSLAYASNWHIFFVWMVASSIILLTIAILFLRNQMKPIQALAEMAEKFGKGQETKGKFHLRGAQEIRRAGYAFLQMRQRIKRAIEQRTAMLNGVSHDLGTVLTRFKLQLALVPNSKHTKALAKDIQDMQNMLQAYLDFAKAETSEQLKIVDIGEIINSFEKQAKAKKCTWQVHIEGNQTIIAKPSSMLRLISNIISNALRFATKIEIEIKKKNKWLVIEFHDDGPGIKAAMRRQAFKPFVRLDEARNLNDSGAGLGLSIAKDIVHNIGGNIKLGDSHLGGLKVSLRIPA